MNMKEPTVAHGPPAGRARVTRIEALLSRYPGLTDPEIHEVLLFLRNGRVLELGFLSGNDAIMPQLERFRADHAHALSIGRRGLAVAAILLLVTLASIVLLWDAGSR